LRGPASKATTSSSILHRKYTTWLAERGYQPMTADELSRQIQGDKPRDQFAADKLSDVQWLDGFIREWNDAADCGDAGAGPASGGPLSISTFTVGSLSNISANEGYDLLSAG